MFRPMRVPLPRPKTESVDDAVLGRCVVIPLLRRHALIDALIYVFFVLLCGIGLIGELASPGFLGRDVAPFKVPLLVFAFLFGAYSLGYLCFILVEIRSPLELRVGDEGFSFTGSGTIFTGIGTVMWDEVKSIEADPKSTTVRVFAENPEAFWAGRGGPPKVHPEFCELYQRYSGVSGKELAGIMSAQLEASRQGQSGAPLVKVPPVVAAPVTAPVAAPPAAAKAAAPAAATTTRATPKPPTPKPPTPKPEPWRPEPAAIDASRVAGAELTLHGRYRTRTVVGATMIALVLIIAGGVLLLGRSGDTKSTASFSGSVEVSALAPAGTTVTNVTAGQQVTISASGSWCGYDGGCGKPTGIRAANADETGMILPSAQIGALIARVGSGPWFLVGSSSTFVADRSGQLVLLFNDRADYYFDNSGSISVAVTVGP